MSSSRNWLSSGLWADISALTRNRPLNTKSASQTQLRRGAFRSFFRSKFKAPKTALSHGFRGLAAIKAGAEPAMLSGRLGRTCFAAPASARFHAGLRAFRPVYRPPLSSRLAPANRPSAEQIPGAAVQTTQKRRRICRLGSFALFRERIQSPKNAPIARFSGLGRYQSRSEMGSDFQGAGRLEQIFASGPVFAVAVTVHTGLAAQCAYANRVLDKK